MVEGVYHITIAFILTFLELAIFIVFFTNYVMTLVRRLGHLRA